MEISAISGILTAINVIFESVLGKNRRKKWDQLAKTRELMTFSASVSGKGPRLM